MITLHLTSASSDIGKLIRVLGEKRLPMLTDSLMRAANFVQAEWARSIMKSSAKEGWKSQYVDSITIEKTKNLEVDIFTDSRYATWTEDGIKRFDMKPGILKGKKFARIPFRHFAPGSDRRSTMSKVVYDSVKNLKAGQKLSGGDWHNIGRYSRIITVKGKLKQKDMAETKSGKYEGMIKTGAKGHSQYMTFRTVSRNSVGWIYPGVPGVRVFSKLKNRLDMEVKRMMSEGLMQDIQSGVDFIASRASKR